MKLALIQERVTDDKPANVEKSIAAVRKAADDGARMVVFPELGFEPFYPQHQATPGARDLAEPVPGPITDRFSTLAAELDLVMVLNLFERDGDHCFDCSPVIDADGTLLGKTRMLHVADFPGFREKGYYSQGTREVEVFRTAVGSVGVAICYDRHFPEYMRALALAGADLVVIPQAGAVEEWPPGMFEAEVRTAAFQNGYFAALCNRVGAEERITFGGASFVAGPDGALLAQAPAGQDAILLTDLDWGTLDDAPARRLFLPDRLPEVYEEWFRVGE